VNAFQLRMKKVMQRACRSYATIQNGRPGDCAHADHSQNRVGRRSASDDSVGALQYAQRDGRTRAPDARHATPATARQAADLAVTHRLRGADLCILPSPQIRTTLGVAR